MRLTEVMQWAGPCYPASLSLQLCSTSTGKVRTSLAGTGRCGGGGEGWGVVLEAGWQCRCLFGADSRHPCGPSLVFQAALCPAVPSGGAAKGGRWSEEGYPVGMLRRGGMDSVPDPCLPPAGLT